jgi:hypothetical protein
VSVNEPIELNVVIVLAERVDQHLGHLQPPDVKAKLKKNQSFYNQRGFNAVAFERTHTCAIQSQCVIIEHTHKTHSAVNFNLCVHVTHLEHGKNGKIEVDFSIAANRLSSDQGGDEVRVHRQRHHLQQQHLQF